MELFILPQPRELVAIVLLLVFVLFHFERYFRVMERKLHLQKLRLFLLGFIISLPLLFANWQDADILELVPQIISYALSVAVCSLFGLISAPEPNKLKLENKKPQE